RVQLISGGGQEQPIAEYVIGGPIALRHRVVESDRALRAGEWRYGYWGRGYVDEVYGSSLGLIGYGRIGKEVVKRAVACGMRCRALTLHPERSSSADAVCEIGPLADAAAVDSLVAESDAIAIC